MVYGVSQAFAVNAKNELTTAVGLACTYDASGTGGHSTEILGYAYDTAWNLHGPVRHAARWCANANRWAWHSR